MTQIPESSGPMPGQRLLLPFGELNGTVTIWNKTSGYILPATPVAHPRANKNGGCIWFHLKDVECKEPLAVGTPVTFILYEEDRGLGCCAVKAPGGTANIPRVTLLVDQG